MATSSIYLPLPEDIVPDILSGLPAKSLLRFRTVCKSWLSIISDSQFIRSHCHIAANRKPKLLVTQTLLNSNKCYEYFYMPDFVSLKYQIIGSCNGIVCISKFKFDKIYLWNPSIKQCTRLPPASNRNVSSIGFGCDSISHDYKVVVVPFGSYYNSVELVYLFSTNAFSWREIPVLIPEPCSSAVFINGVLYVEVRAEKNNLLSFDLHHEVFKVILLPICVLEIRSNLLDFEGSLAIITVDSISDGSVHQEISPRLGDAGDGSVHPEISLWTLEEGCELSRSNWIKKFTFEANLWVDMYLGAGEFYGFSVSVHSNLFRYGRRRYCSRYNHIDPEIISHVWYDDKKKNCSSFHLQYGGFPEILKYTESLVSFKGFKSTEWLSREYSLRQLQKQEERKERREKWEQECEQEREQQWQQEQWQQWEQYEEWEQQQEQREWLQKQRKWQQKQQKWQQKRHRRQR